MNQKSIKIRIETKMVTMFKNQTALNFLLKHGHVYTCRIHRHKLGKDWVNYPSLKGGACFVRNNARVD